MRKFKIEGEQKDDEGEPLYWSNECGWTDFYNGTEFKEKEITKINFPMDAKSIRWSDKDGTYTWCKENNETIKQVNKRLKP